MKRLLIYTINIIIFFTVTLSLVFFSFNSETNAFFVNTFIPSENNINSINNNSNSSTVTQLPSNKSFSDFTENTIDKNGFYLRIDKIALFKAIVPDVDPRNKDEYVKSWETGISHGKFTSKPDKIGITYLFAHAISNKSSAASKNAWFSNLDLLSLNDEIIIYYNGIKYFYSVSNIFVVSPNATAFYTGASMIPMVRLQYCGPPTGSLDSRTLVDALLINHEII